MPLKGQYQFCLLSFICIVIVFFIFEIWRWDLNRPGIMRVWRFMKSKAIQNNMICPKGRESTKWRKNSFCELTSKWQTSFTVDKEKEGKLFQNCFGFFFHMASSFPTIYRNYFLKFNSLKILITLFFLLLSADILVSSFSQKCNFPACISHQLCITKHSPKQCQEAISIYSHDHKSRGQL